jgi:DNA anti-recombination protein RmuC
MLKMVGEISGRVGEITDRVGEMTQTVNSHSQSIAKLEAQVGQIANTLNRRKEGKLPSQLVVNPKGHYRVNEGTSHH